MVQYRSDRVQLKLTNDSFSVLDLSFARLTLFAPPNVFSPISRSPTAACQQTLPSCNKGARPHSPLRPAVQLARVSKGEFRFLGPVPTSPPTLTLYSMFWICRANSTSCLPCQMTPLHDGHQGLHSRDNEACRQKICARVRDLASDRDSS